MRVYVVINRITERVFGNFRSKVEASEKVESFIQQQNASKGDNVLTIFDFDIIEKEYSSITSYEDAKKYLQLSEDSMTMISVSKKHERALSAISKLLILAEAHNQEDGFIPDLSNKEQPKFIPVYSYYHSGLSGFICAAREYRAQYTIVNSLLCFQTQERAFDFGKRYEDLFNDFLRCSVNIEE